MNKLAALLSLVAIVAVFLLFQRMEEQDEHLQTRVASNVAPEVEHIEIAVIMGRIQRFHQKFWLAIRAGNAELAQFYLHEMEEAMEEIADAGLEEDGVDVSGPMRTYGLAVVEHLEVKLKNEGMAAMISEADLLVNACNTCHNATGYAMVRIQVPEQNTFPDQNFAVQ